MRGLAQRNWPRHVLGLLEERFAWPSLSALYRAVIIFGFVALLAPTVIVVVSSFSASRYLAFPPEGLSLRWYQRFFDSPAYTGSFWVSIRVAVASMVIALFIGSAAAFVIDRYRFPGRQLLESFLLSPMMVPPLVAGIALLQFVSVLGLPRNLALLIIGHLLLTTPYVIRTMLASLAGFDRSMEEAAMSLGATPVKTLWRVTLPILQPGFVAAGVFAFERSFGNVVMSLFLTGRGTTPLPVHLFAAAEQGLDPTVTAASSIVVIITVATILIIDRVTGLQRMAV